MLFSDEKKRRITSLIRGNIVLALFALTVWLVADPSIQFGTVKIIDDDYPGDVESWQFTGHKANTRVDDDLVSVTPIEPKRASVYKQYSVDITNSNEQYLRIEGMITGKRFRANNNEGQQLNKPSIFYAWFENELKERIHIHILAELKNSEEPVKYVDRMLIPPTATTFNIGLLLRQFEHSFTLEKLQIKQIERTVVYWILLAGIAVFAIYLMFKASRWVQQSTKLVVATVVAATVCMLVIGVIAPGGSIQGIINYLLEPLKNYFNLDDGVSISSIQDSAHIIGFFALTFIALQLGSPTNIDTLNILIKLGLFALLTEALQRHTVVRSSSLQDIISDCVGILLGYACWYWVSNRKRNSNELA